MGRGGVPHLTPRPRRGLRSLGPLWRCPLLSLSLSRVRPGTVHTCFPALAPQIFAERAWTLVSCCPSSVWGTAAVLRISVLVLALLPPGPVRLTSGTAGACAGPLAPLPLGETHGGRGPWLLGASRVLCPSSRQGWLLPSKGSRILTWKVAPPDCFPRSWPP